MPPIPPFLRFLSTHAAHSAHATFAALAALVSSGRRVGELIAERVEEAFGLAAAAAFVGLRLRLSGRE